MAKTYRTALIITGDAKGGVRAVKATERQIESLGREQKKTIARNKRMARSFRGLSAEVGGLGGALSALGGGFAIYQLVRSIDLYTRLEGKLRLVTDSSRELAEIQDKLFRLAQSTRSEYGATVELYARVARSAESVGISQSQLLEVTELTNKAIQISGATATEASAGVIQFAQAMASGQLRGEELRSVMEQLPRLAIALAEGLETDIGGLRALAEQGELTADRVVDALLSQGRAIRQEYQRLPRTISQALTQLQNDVQRAFSETNTQPLLNGIDDLRERLTDPQTIQSLQIFSNAVVTAMGWAATAVASLTSDIQTLTEDIASAVHGPGTRLFQLNTEIEQIDRKLSGGALSRTGVFVLDGELQFHLSEQDLQDARDKLVAERAKLRDKLGIVVSDPLEVTGEQPSSDLPRLQLQSSTVNKLRQEYDQLSAGLSKQIALFGQTSDVAELRYRLEFGDLTRLADPRKQHLLSMAQELQLLEKQKQTVAELFPAWQRLQQAQQLRDSVSGLPPEMQEFGRRRANGMIAEAATQGLPGMTGLDPMYNGPFGEANRLEGERSTYETAYQDRLESFRLYAQTHQQDAVAAYAAIEALEKQHQQRMLSYDTQINKARRDGYEDLFGSLTDIVGTFAGDQSGIYQAMFAAQKGFHIASVLMNSVDAISKAWASAPFPYNLPAVGVTVAETGALQAMVSGVTLSGQAHDGIDSVPNTGTWNLEKGERIIDRRTNVDLKHYLDRQNTGKSGGGAVYITAPVTVQAQPGMSQADAARQGRQIGDAMTATIRRVLIDEKRSGGILSEAS